MMLFWMLAMYYSTCPSHGVTIPSQPLNFSRGQEEPSKTVEMPTITTAQIIEVFQKANENAGKRSAFDAQLAKEGQTIRIGKVTLEGRAQGPALPKTLRIHDVQETLEDINRQLIEKFNLTQDQILYGLPKLDLPDDPLLQICQALKKVDPCDVNSPFRTADGSCNNLNNIDWGSVYSCYGNLMTSDYADYISSPRASEDKTSLPNPRQLSTKVMYDVDVKSTDYSHMVVHFAQFLAHDMAQSSSPVPANQTAFYKCCPLNASLASSCHSFEISKDDRFYKDNKQDCHPFIRTTGCPKDCKLGRQRKQVNQQSAFIDASVIYGISDNDINASRTLEGGLRYQDTPGSILGWDILLPPRHMAVFDQCSQTMEINPITSQPYPCFQSGDPRVNVQPGLTIMHTIWFRLHNIIAEKLRKSYLTFSDEELFQNTRRIVGAMMQAVTYKELLPLLLGQNYTDIFNLRVGTDGYTTYNDSVNPTIFSEFSSASFRLHTLVQTFFKQVSKNGINLESLKIQDYAFHPMHMYQGKTDSLVRGMCQEGSQTFDRHFVEGISQHLFQLSGEHHGVDLVAKNIQRGRDHGLPGYSKLIEYCYDVKINQFEDLKQVMCEENILVLQTVYKSVHDVDAYLGGVMEYPLPGGMVGPTFGCFIGMQFKRLKDGDRFYFEHGGQTGSFSEGQLNEIRKTTLSRIICDTTGIGNIQGEVFRIKSDKNPVMDCKEIPRVNLSNWMEK